MAVSNPAGVRPGKPRIARGFPGGAGVWPGSCHSAHPRISSLACALLRRTVMNLAGFFVYVARMKCRPGVSW